MHLVVPNVMQGQPAVVLKSRLGMDCPEQLNGDTMPC